MSNEHAHGVETIAERVGNNGNRNGDAGAGADGERESDRDAVEEDVAGHPNGAEHTGGGVRVAVAMVSVAVERLVAAGELLEEVQHHESGHEQHHHERDVQQLARVEFEDLGDEVERDKSQEQPRTQAEHEVQALVGLECEQATEEGGEDGCERDCDSHTGSLRLNENDYQIQFEWFTSDRGLGRQRPSPARQVRAAG